MSEAPGPSEPGAMPVTVTYRLSDYYAGMARRWRAWLIAFVVLATFAILLPLVFALLDGCTLRCAWASMDWGFSGLLFLFVLAWLFAAPVLSFLLAKRRGDLAPITFTLTDAGVQLENRSGQSVLYWTGMKGVGRTRYGVVFLVRSQLIGIPRRAFDSDEQFETFVAAARHHWKQLHRL